MDAASKTGIDDVRELIENSKYNPTSAKYKVFIIDEIHMLSKQAFNGLLKTLEEPPEKLKFIFATTEARKIPVTILSRCQRFDLRRVKLSQITDHLKKISEIEKGKISEEAIKMLSKASEGSVRDAVSLLDRALVFQNLKGEEIVTETDVRKMLGLADKTKILNLFKYIFEGDEKNSINLLRDLIDQGLDPKSFLNDVLELLYLFNRRINLGPIEKDLFLSESEIALVENLSKNLNTQDLALFWQLTLKTIEDLKIVSNENITLEMYLMQLMHIKEIEQSNDIQESENISSQVIHQENISSDKDKDLKSKGSIKDQLRNIDQIKTFIKNKTDPDINNDQKVKIKSFEELVELTNRNKEMELKYDLERNVKLVKFEDGKIDINFNDKLNKSFIKKLSQNLFKWTGKRWIISLSKNESYKTLKEIKLEEKDKSLKNEKTSLISEKVYKTFSDADLIEVKDKNE